MLLSRRSLAKGAIATLFVASGQADRASGQASPPRQVPTPDDLLSGDLLWPKKPNAYVPYNAGSDADYERERKQWDSEKRRFIDNVRQKADAPRELRELANQLEVMEFREFLARYEDDERPGVPDTYGAGLPLYVGHMAIVFMDGRVPSVVEALYGKGVVTSTYEAWLRGRPGELVWHGRVRDAPDGARARIADFALPYKGRPYDFWNFDLSDDRGFYCSKLAWFAVIKALGFPLDGNPVPTRFFWFSPKQAMRSERIYLLNNPGSYTYPLPTR